MLQFWLLTLFTCCKVCWSCLPHAATRASACSRHFSLWYWHGFYSFMNALCAGENYLRKVRSCKNGLAFKRKILQGRPSRVIWGVSMICWQADPLLTTARAKARTIFSTKWIDIQIQNNCISNS